MEIFDVAIIGAGPAGSTLARLLDKKFKIFLADKKDFSREDSFKCCGGLLAPDGQKMLAKLNLSLPKEIMADPQIFSVKVLDLDNSLEKYYQRFYFNLDRGKFERYLVSLLPPQIVFEQNCFFKNFEKEKDYIKINLQKDSKIFQIFSKKLIFASGANPVSSSANIKTKKYVAIQEWFKSKTIPAHFLAIFDSRITDFYSWIIPKEKQLILGAALEIGTGKNANELFSQLKNKLTKHGFNFDFKIKKESAMIYRPVSANQINAGEGSVGCVGEAAGLISPSSAEGFSYAFESASMMAEALNEDFDNFLAIYKKKIRKIKTNIFLKNLKSIFMYNRFLRKITIKSGLGSLNIQGL